MKRFFFGGVHPEDKKRMSAGSVECPPVIPRCAVIPLQQHIGAPCRPLVQVGERVLRGQKIGDGEGMCVPVHASVSGTVRAIEARRHPSGRMIESVVIDNDFLDETVEFCGNDAPVERLDGDAVLRAVREAGIVGLGGAAFPGDLKALSALGKIDTFIANACECEPYITSDDALLRTAPEQALDGMMILSCLLSPSRTVLAIEDNKTDAIAKLNALKTKYPAIEIAVLPTRYPQGGEKQLIQAVTGRQVPPGGLPSSVGCLVYNISTVAAVFRAVREGMPLIERTVTVSGEAVAKPQNFTVRIGTPFGDVIEAAGGLTDPQARVIAGGPMMGTAQSDLSAPVVKATNAVLCLPQEKHERTAPPVCIRCGKCVSVCPMHLEPLYLYRETLAGRTKALVRLHIADCMECGCCSYICPGKLPLAETFRKGKILVKEADAT